MRVMIKRFEKILETDLESRAMGSRKISQFFILREKIHAASRTVLKVVHKV